MNRGSWSQAMPCSSRPSATAAGDAAQVGQPTQQQRDRGAEQDAEAEGAAGGQVEDAAAQEDRGEGERTGHRPDEGLQAGDRHAQQRGSVGAVGAGPDGRAGGAAVQEHVDRNQHHRGDDEPQRVVGVEHDGADGAGGVEGQLDAAGHQVEVHRRGSSSVAATSTWLRPMVAMVTSSRGSGRSGG